MLPSNLKFLNEHFESGIRFEVSQTFKIVNQEMIHGKSAAESKNTPA